MKDCKKEGLAVFTIRELIELGNTIDEQLSDPDVDDLFTICYTSGTTGNPKGVMLTHRNMLGLLASLPLTPIRLKNTDVHLSYLPLAHILERIVVHSLAQYGGSIGFYQGDILKVKEDLASLRPTIFVSVPRMYSRFYDLMQGKIAELKGLKRKLADKAVRTKLSNLNKNGSVKHCLYDKLIFKKFKQVLGGRVRIAITGSAPISTEVLDFMKIAF